MGKFIDETGKTYGFLYVLERGENDNQNKPKWKCKCLKCNKNIIELNGYRLRKGLSTQCKECAYKEKEEKRHKELYEKILNKTFGHLYVIKRDENSGGAGHDVKWICQCDCGNIISVSTYILNTRGQKTCGDPNCLYRNKVLSESKTEDLTNMTFGDLLVLYKSDKKWDSARTTFWHCKCKCGNELDVSRDSLIKGKRQCCDLCLDGKSIGENNIRKILFDNKIKFKPEQTFSDLRGINNGVVRFDFGIYENDKLIRIVEFDGEFHYVTIDIWNSEETKQNDKIKTDYCIKNNIPLVRIPYWERDNIDLEMIMGDKFLVQSKEIV